MFKLMPLAVAISVAAPALSPFFSLARPRPLKALAKFGLSLIAWSKSSIAVATARCAARTWRGSWWTPPVQPKNVTFPTDAKLLHAAIKGHNRLAKKHGVWLRQSYLRLAKRAAMMAGRYAHAKQFKRNKRQLHILRTRLDRLVRDIRRKIEGKENIVAAFAWPRTHANHIRSQQQRQRGWKLYSFHARGRVHWQGQRPHALRVRRQSLDRHYQCSRTQISLANDVPYTRPIERFGDVVAHPILGGLCHRYA